MLLPAPLPRLGPIRGLGRCTRWPHEARCPPSRRSPPHTALTPPSASPLAPCPWCGASQELERKREQQEARKHVEWMKQVEEARKSNSKSGAADKGDSPTSSQAASDASTAVFGVPSSTPGRASPNDVNSTPLDPDVAPASATPPVSPPGQTAPPGLQFSKTSQRSKDGWSAFGGGGGGGGAFGGGGSGFCGFGGDLCAPSDGGTRAAAGGGARYGASGGFLDKEQLLRSEIGTLREQLQAKEAQCSHLGSAAARTDEVSTRPPHPTLPAAATPCPAPPCALVSPRPAPRPSVPLPAPSSPLRLAIARSHLVGRAPCQLSRRRARGDASSTRGDPTRPGQLSCGRQRRQRQ